MNKRRVILEKVTDKDYIARFDLKIYDPHNSLGFEKILARAHAYNLDNRILLVLRTPRHGGTDSCLRDVPFGIADRVQEVDSRLYKRLLEETPKLVIATDEFRGFYDETGMGKHYTRIPRNYYTRISSKKVRFAH